MPSPGARRRASARAGVAGWLAASGAAASPHRAHCPFSGGADSFLIFKIGGGSANGVRLALRDASGRELAAFRGADDQVLRTMLVDLGSHSDGELHLDVIDGDTGRWGHLLLDAVMLLDLEPLPSEQALSSQRDDALHAPRLD
jgi:hypothetical protein